MFIQQTYSKYQQRGLPGMIARPNAPHDIDRGQAGVEVEPGMGVYYSASTDRFILPVSAATRKLVTHVVSYFPTAYNTDITSPSTNNTSEVVYAIDAIIPLIALGSFLALAGATLENEDAVIYNETTEKWIKYEPASPTANDLRAVPFVAYLDPGKTAADGDIIEIRHPGRNYSFPSLNNLPEITAKVTITAADIKLLRATPYELVAAQGADTLIDFVSAKLVLTAGTEVLTETDANLVVEYDDGAAVVISEVVECTGFIDSAADIITNAIQVKDNIDASADIVNKNIALFNDGAGEFAGNASDDASLDVYVTYRVLDLS